MCVPAPVVYVLEVRRHPKGMRTKREHWESRGAYLTRAEAVAAAHSPTAAAVYGWRVTEVRAEGALAGLVTTEELT